MGTLDYKLGKDTKCGSRFPTYSPKKVGESKIRCNRGINSCQHSGRRRWKGQTYIINGTSHHTRATQ